MSWSTCLLSILACAATAVGQTHLIDGNIAVVTNAGLFLVDEGPPGSSGLIVPAADFGLGDLRQPSVTWISGTDSFIVTTRGDPGPSQLFRVDIGPAFTATVVDLSPTVPVIAPQWIDADYAKGLAQLFLIDGANMTVMMLQGPDITTAAGMTVFATGAPAEARSIAVHGTEPEFGVIVAARLEVRRFTANDSTQLFDNSLGSWHQTDENPVTGEFYLLNEKSDSFGVLHQGFPFGFMQDFNLFGFCTKPVNKPVDMEWDALKRKMIVLGEDGVDPCLFGSVVTGPNHLVRMPYVQGGPPGNVPTLLTPQGPSGIFGTNGDLALVRSSAADVTFFGESGQAGDGTRPRMFNGSGYNGSARLDKNVTFSVREAPANTTAYLFFGHTLLAAPFGGHVMYPVIDWIVSSETDAEGDATFTTKVPDDDAFVGARFWAQWWLPDTTTAMVGDVVGSQGGVYTIGKK